MVSMPDSTPDFRLAYDNGTLILLDPPPDYEPPSPFIWDARVDRWRAQAHRYREIVEYFRTLETVPKITAPRYNTLRLEFTPEHNPHPHQAEALKAWQSYDHQGIVVLPTGSGKSYLALMAIAELNRSTLIVAPTIDLMNQWYDLLIDAFSCEIGILGGGYHEIEDLTVTTYDSAWAHRALPRC